MPICYYDDDFGQKVEIYIKIEHFHNYKVHLCKTVTAKY